MKALAIDTTGEAMGLAFSAGDGQIHLSVQRAGLRHAERLAPAIETLLAAAGVAAASLELVVAATGPGSFTGIRIGMATAKGLALGAGCPVVGIPTLDALAHRFASLPVAVVPVIDARKGRLYAALYRAGERRTDLLDLAPEDLAETLRAHGGGVPHLFTGPHAATFGAFLRERGHDPASFAVDPGFADTDPYALLALGLRRFAASGADAPRLGPIYLRASEAEIKAGGAS